MPIQAGGEKNLRQHLKLFEIQILQIILHPDDHFFPSLATNQ